MTDKERFLLWLSQFGFSSKKVEGILSLCHDVKIEEIKDVKGLDTILKYEEVVKLREESSTKSIERYFAALEKHNIKVLSKFLPNFPQKLVLLPDCPAFLFCQGDISLLDKFSVAIVGSRKPSNYGRVVTEEFAGAFAKSGVVVISGLAYGIDSIAHRKTLEEGGKTIAVLGSGLCHIYPSEHTDLAKEIAQKGLLVSEKPPATLPSKYTFIERNRIIAGLSDAVVITEAGLKSGTRTTKEYAMDYGKNIYAVPGSIKSLTSQLPNHLIACGHAKCLTSPEELLSDFELDFSAKTNFVNLSIEDSTILNLLQTGEKDIAYLQEKSGFDIKKLQTRLTFLEIRGIIKKLPGNFYAAI